MNSRRGDVRELAVREAAVVLGLEPLVALTGRGQRQAHRDDVVLHLLQAEERALRSERVLGEELDERVAAQIEAGEPLLRQQPQRDGHRQRPRRSQSAGVACRATKAEL